MEPICIVPTGDVCGEAATWDAAANRIYWTDINRFLLHSHDPDSGATRTHMFDRPVVALSLTDKKGWLLVALGSQPILFNPEDGVREDLPVTLGGWPELRFNDGAIPSARSGSARWATMSARTEKVCQSWAARERSTATGMAGQ